MNMQMNEYEYESMQGAVVKFQRKEQTGFKVSCGAKPWLWMPNWPCGVARGEESLAERTPHSS